MGGGLGPAGAETAAASRTRVIQVNRRIRSFPAPKSACDLAVVTIDHSGGPKSQEKSEASST
jgi:hypothetical protein